MELINESLLENMAKDKYTIPQPRESTSTLDICLSKDEQNIIRYTIPQPRESTSTLDIRLSKDEQNIIRYACGYVGVKLHNRFVKQHGEKAASFVECIDYMHAVGPSSSLLEYTREWVDKVDRGGLFDVSDEAFRLFVAIEMVLLTYNLCLHKIRKQRLLIMLLVIVMFSSIGACCLLTFVMIKTAWNF